MSPDFLRNHLHLNGGDDHHGDDEKDQIVFRHIHDHREYDVHVGQDHAATHTA